MKSGSRLSQRAYAAHRKERGLPGATLGAVQKALKARRITLEPDGLIDPAKADAAWASRTDPAKQTGQVKAEGPRNLKVMPPPKQKETTAGGGDGAPQPKQDDYWASKAAREYYEAELARMKCEERSGALVPPDTVRRALFDAGRIVRNGHEDLVVSLAPQLAGLTDLDPIEQLLRKEFRALDERFAQQVEKQDAGNDPTDSGTDL